MAGAYKVGAAYVTVAPVFTDFNKKASDAGRGAGEEYRRGFEDGWGGKEFEPVPGKSSDRERKSRSEGEKAGGAYANAFARTIEKLGEQVTPIDVEVKNEDAKKKVAEINTILAGLKDKRLDVDVDSAEANAQLQRIAVLLKELDAKDVDTSVRVDAAAARAQIAAFNTQLDKLGMKEVSIDVDMNTDGAMAHLAALAAATDGAGFAAMGGAARFGGLAAALTLVTAAAIPAAGALGMVGAAAGAMASGLAAGAGAGAIALAPVLAGVKALSQAEKTAASDAQSHATAITNARRQVANAERAVSDARMSSAAAIEAASRREQDANRALIESQKKAKKAQEDLVEARREAVRQMAELNQASRDASLNVKDTELSVREARERAANVKARRDRGDTSVSSLDVERADLSVEQAISAHERAKRAAVEAAREAAEANKRGVEGSKVVKSALDGVASAQQNVADKARDLKDAQAAVAKAHTDGALRIAQAQQQLADAQAAVTAAMAKTTTAQNNVADAMKNLSPQGRILTLMIRDMTNGFYSLSKASQEAMFPGFIQAIKTASPLANGFRSVIVNLSRTMGDLAADGAADLVGEQWRRTGTVIGVYLPKLLDTGARALGNLFKGIAGIMAAVAPDMDKMSLSFLGMTQRFADWAGSLDSNPSFQNFMAGLRQDLPRVKGFFSALWDGLVNIGKALLPLGRDTLDALTSFFEWIARQDPNHIRAVATALGAIGLGFAALGTVGQVLASVRAVFTGLSGMATIAGGLARIISGLSVTMFGFSAPVLIVVGVIGLLIGAFALLYTKSETFRNFINGIGASIAGVFQQVWGAVSGFFMQKLPQMKQILNDFATALSMIWNFIVATAKVIWTHFGGMVMSIWSTLWETVKNVFMIAWQGITMMFSGVLNVVQGILRLFISIFTGDWKGAWNAFVQIAFGLGQILASVVATAFRLIWTIIKGIFNLIVGIISGAWNGIISISLAAVNWVVGIVTSFGGKVKDKFNDMRNRIVDIASRLWGTVKDTFGKMKDGVVDTIGKMVSGAQSAWYNLKSVFATPINAVIDMINDPFLAGIKKFAGKIPGGKFDWVQGIEIKRIPGYARGGMIPGRPAFGYDDRMGLIDGKKPITVGSGEYIVNAMDTQRFRPILDAINFGHGRGLGAFFSGGIVKSKDVSNTTIPGFADGGFIDSMKRVGSDIVKSVLGRAGGSGKRVWPTTSRRMSGNYPGHGGIDFPVPIGTPIFAATDGTISYTGTGRGYGIAVFERLANGMEAVYGHTSRPLVSPGQQVKAGQQIALSGNTGRSTGPHLHFEINTSGRWMNPANRVATLNWLNGATLQGGGISGLLSGAGRMLSSMVPGLGFLGPIIDAAQSDPVQAAIKAVAGLFDPWKKETDEKYAALDGFGFADIAKATSGDLKNQGQTSVQSTFAGIIEKVKGAFNSMFSSTDSSPGAALNIAPDPTTGNPGLVPGTAVTRWRAMVAAALKRQGAPATAANIQHMLNRIAIESGGNPKAINLWDSNYRRGTPSKGLVQFIDPTFQAQRDPSLPNNIWDPWANINAAVRRFLFTYHGNFARASRPGGYAKGGVVDARKVPTFDAGGRLAPGLNLVNNRTGDWETVLRADSFHDRGVRTDHTGPLVSIDTLANTDPEIIAESLMWEIKKARHAGLYQP